MRSRNWDRDRQRRLMRDRGTKAAGDPDQPYGVPAGKKRKAKPTKAQMRAQLDLLMRETPAKKPMEENVPRGDRPIKGLVIYCDGACEPNPGAGGWGFVVYRDGVEIHADCGGDVQSTNQRMELTAALMSLRWFARRGIVESVRLFSDSKYTVDGCNSWRHSWKAKGWKRNGKNPHIVSLELWQALDEALTLVPINLEWVKGHAGILGNERADELALMGREKALEEELPDAIEQQLTYEVV